MPEGASRYQPFPTTKWTLVLRIAGGDAEDRESALAEICELYHPPVRAYIRNLGHGPHDADDLVQEFFARFLKNGDFGRPDPERGSLRRYLLVSVKHFLASEHRRASRRKRGGGAVLVSLDVGDGSAEELLGKASDAESPERIFDREWASALLENARRKLEAHYASKGQAELHSRLEAVVDPGAAAVDRTELAQSLGVTEGALRVHIHRLRERYRRILHDEIAATLGSKENAEEELAYLRSLVG